MKVLEDIQAGKRLYFWEGQ